MVKMIAPKANAFATFLFTAAAVSAGTAKADPRGLDATYELYMGGFQVATAELGVGYKADCFDVSLTAEPDGIVALLTSFKIESWAGGCRNGARVIPASYRSDYYKNGKKKRWVQLNYGQNGLPEIKAKPAAKDDDRDIVPEDMREGSLDPMMATFGIIEAVTRENRCSGEKPVYDGRRLFRLRLEHVGEASLKPTRYSAYHGPAIECLVKIEMVAGFKKNEIKKRHFPEEIRVFLAEAIPGSPLVPVRLESDYRFGQLRAHVSKLKPHPVPYKESRLR